MDDRRASLDPTPIPASPTIASFLYACAATILLAGLLPITFAYRPNTLGIVSYTTLTRYPKQQDVFWYAFSVSVVVLLALAVLPWLRRGESKPGRALALESSAAAALCAALLARGPWNALLPAVLLGAALAPTLRRPASPAPPPPILAAAPPLGRRGLWLGTAALILLSVLFTPRTLESVCLVVARVADGRLTDASWMFQAEFGEYLSWADRIRRGQLHGRDFFTLYGPLYDFGQIGAWAVLGRSIAASSLYMAWSYALGFFSLLLLGAGLLRHRLLLLALPLLVAQPSLRIGLPFIGVASLVRWRASGRPRWALGAGLVGGIALLYSQEYGIAFLLAAALLLALAGGRSSGLRFLAGLAAAVLPVLAYFAARGALGAFLRDLAAYPGYVMAGFGNLPFPDLLAALPLRAREIGTEQGIILRAAYVPPAILVGGFLLALPLGVVRPGKPRATFVALRDGLRRDPIRLGLLATAVFGLIAFRSALGRSGMTNFKSLMPIAALLLLCGLDRSLDLRAGGARALAIWRVAALSAAAWAGAFFATAAPLATVRGNLETAALYAQGFRPSGDEEVNSVISWIVNHTAPSDRVYFVPEGAAYYYLVDRRNPTRFDLPHQMVTDAHRAEALADLRAHPPKYIVTDAAGWQVDGLSDELIYGPPFLHWWSDHYELEGTIGSLGIYRRKSAGDGP